MPNAPRGPLDQTDRPVAPFFGTERQLPEPLPASPFPLFEQWFEQARALKTQPNPNAFALASCDPAGVLSNRIVLCKGIDTNAGFVVFYTNYSGRKGRDLDANPRAAACFHWDALDRQVRMEGWVTRSPEAESDAYFQSRPWISRIGAWASDQSRPIASRDALAAKVDATCRRFGIDPANPPSAAASIEIPRPPHWGGFRLYPARVELWVGGVGRLHDRAEWTREVSLSPQGPTTGAAWRSTRLQP